MNGQLGGQPVFILPEGTMRDTGKDAQSRNISAGRAVSESVRTTLGPKGMDKMLVDSIGDVTITNDGATILDEMEIEHPAAKMMVEVAKTQEDEVGDGTTTAVIIAGELLKKAEGLLDQEIHPTVIIKGFRVAKAKAMELLNKLGEDVDLKNKDLLTKTAMTAMTGKGSEAAKEDLAKLAVESVISIVEEKEGKTKIDKDDIKIEKAQGGSIDDTELIKGLVIDKEIAHSNMPKHVESTKIALLDEALEVKETETNAEIRISDPKQLQGFVEQEGKMLKEMVSKIKESGCNVLFCQKGIDDLAQYYLSKEGIAAVRRVKKSDMEKLAKSTGAKIVSNLDELEVNDLGESGVVEERKITGEKMTFIRKCKNPKSVTILLRGGTEHVVDEAERAMEDAVLGVISAIENGKVVPGGGSTEMEISKELRGYADSVGGREQLAINGFADALEVVPRTLAESTGMDPIDILVDIRTKHEEGSRNYGVNVLDGGGTDMVEKGIVEPSKIKTQAISSASEAAEMILRIDDVVSSKGSEGGEGGAGGAPGGGAPAGGMPPGAGGMPGM